MVRIKSDIGTLMRLWNTLFLLQHGMQISRCGSFGQFEMAFLCGDLEFAVDTQVSRLFRIKLQLTIYAINFNCRITY